jgi:pilus assembly protein CpaB
MRPKSLILLSLALGCGLVASVGINQVMSKGSAVVQAPSEKVAVFVAKKEIAMNDLITPDMLTTKQLPKDVVPKGALTSMKEVEDRRAATKIIIDDILLDAKLLAKGEKGRATDHLPPGMRSVAIKVDATSTSGFLVKPGDHVDLMVYLKRNGANGVENTLIKTFLQNVRVFAVDNVLTESPEGKGQKTMKTISLLVTPDQAQVVTIASNLGKVTLALRSPKDAELADTSAKFVTAVMQDWFGETPDKKTDEKPQPTVPVAVTDLKPKTNLFGSLFDVLPKKEEKKEHVIEIFAGAEVTRWKTVEGSPIPVKLTDGPPADVSSSGEGGLPFLGQPADEDKEEQEKEEEAPKKEKKGGPSGDGTQEENV